MTNWSEVVREFSPVVWRTAYRLLGNHADAADCFQNAFLAAVELSDTERIRNWPAVLKRIATGRALDQLRSRHRRTTRFSPMPDQPLADASALDPAALACGGELAEALRVALSAIDPQQAAAFCLVALEEFTNGDAAGQLGITPNHLGVLLHRARTALRERLYAFAPHRLLSPGGRP